MLKAFLLASLCLLVFFLQIPLAKSPRENRQSLGDFIQEELRKNKAQRQQEEDLPQRESTGLTSDPPPEPSLPSQISDETNTTIDQPYLQVVQENINNQWVVPTIAGGGSFITVVSFRLLPTGAIQDVLVEQTSGSSIFDEAGTQAVLNAVPFPRFPPQMSERYLDTTFTFKAQQ